MIRTGIDKYRIFRLSKPRKFVSINRTDLEIYGLKKTDGKFTKQIRPQDDRTVLVSIGRRRYWRFDRF